MFLNNDDSLIVKYCVESVIVEETKTHCRQQLLRHLFHLFLSSHCYNCLVIYSFSATDIIHQLHHLVSSLLYGFLVWLQ